jgi:hypothetical protein
MWTDYREQILHLSGAKPCLATDEPLVHLALLIVANKPPTALPNTCRGRWGTARHALVSCGEHWAEITDHERHPNQSPGMCRERRHVTREDRKTVADL